MKNFKFTGDQLTPSLRDKIADGDLGIYVVYGAFIDGTALNLTRLYKGTFKDITLKIDDPTNVNPDQVEYLLPVPEYIVCHTDAEYAKYLNIHLVPESDIEDDEIMLRKFCEAYTKKLSDAGAADAMTDPEHYQYQDDATEDDEEGEEKQINTEKYETEVGLSLAQMEENLAKLQESTDLLSTMKVSVGLEETGFDSKDFNAQINAVDEAESKIEALLSSAEQDVIEHKLQMQDKNTITDVVAKEV